MNKAEFFVVVTITLIVVGIWGASEFINSKNAATPNPTAKEYLEPVDPNFDQDTLSKISQLETPNPSAATPPPALIIISASASPSARTTPRPSASVGTP